MTPGSDQASRGGGGLRLRARDDEDLQVIAACLQDALIPLREMAYMADDHRFMASFERFQWERLGEQGTPSDLTICQSILRIDHVEAVQYRGIDSDFSGVKFELLTIRTESHGEAGSQLTLVFAGDAALRLQVGELAVSLEDFGEPRPAGVTPRHDLPIDAEEGR
jgi:hypothetical protein